MLQDLSWLFFFFPDVMMLQLAFFLCLLVKTSIVSSCVSDSFINGCSVPINSSSFPYKTLFHPACQRHDVCYVCVSKTMRHN